ncbi:MAG: hypothetical protein B6D55_02455 [Candidatus Omnitrophica bacterium 4484_70.2]|nr:MAG: hypothetical protein B6D55_02455 [Candidatus Omnitrophica bacterium 4484_70.2]
MAEKLFETLRGLYKAFIDVYENGSDEDKMLCFASAVYFLDSEAGNYVGYEDITVVVDPTTYKVKKEPIYNYLAFLLKVYAQQNKKDLEWWLFEKRKYGEDLKDRIGGILNIEFNIEHLK